MISMINSCIHIKYLLYMLSHAYILRKKPLEGYENKFFQKLLMLVVIIKRLTFIVWFNMSRSKMHISNKILNLTSKWKSLSRIISISISIRFFNIILDGTKHHISDSVPDCVVPVCILNRNNLSLKELKCSILC